MPEVKPEAEPASSPGPQPESDEETLARVLMLSQKVLECAQADAWEEVSGLQAQRDAALRMLFTPAPPLLPTEALRESLTAVQAIDQQLIQLSETRRDALQQKLLDLLRSRELARSYPQF